MDPLHNILAVYGANGQQDRPYSSGQGFYDLASQYRSATGILLMFMLTTAQYVWSA